MTQEILVECISRRCLQVAIRTAPLEVHGIDPELHMPAESPGQHLSEMWAYVYDNLPLVQYQGRDDWDSWQRVQCATRDNWGRLSDDEEDDYVYGKSFVHEEYDSDYESLGECDTYDESD